MRCHRRGAPLPADLRAPRRGDVWPCRTPLEWRPNQRSSRRKIEDSMAIRDCGRAGPGDLRCSRDCRGSFTGIVSRPQSTRPETWRTRGRRYPSSTGGQSSTGGFSTYLIASNLWPGESERTRSRRSLGAFQGHTSWEECRFPRFVIPVPSGRRKLKRRSS